MYRSIMTLLGALALGCGGIPDTTDPDTHIIRTVISTNIDGSSTVTHEDLGFDWEGAAQQEEREISDLGQLEQAFSYLPLNGRYGLYSTAGSSTQDARCPANSWPSSTHCKVPKTKKYNWVDVTGHSQDSTMGVDVPAQVAASLAYFKSTYSWHTSDFTVDVPETSGGGFNSIVKLGTAGSGQNCPAGALACTSISTSGFGEFTAQGLRFRYHIKGDGDQFQYYSTIYLVAANIGPFMASGSQSDKNKCFKHTMLHEIGHAIGTAHNPSPNGGLTNSGTTWVNCRDGTLNYTTNETNARRSYQP